MVIKLLIADLLTYLVEDFPRSFIKVFFVLALIVAAIVCQFV